MRTKLNLNFRDNIKCISHIKLSCKEEKDIYIAVTGQHKLISSRTSCFMTKARFKKLLFALEQKKVKMKATRCSDHTGSDVGDE